VIAYERPRRLFGRAATGLALASAAFCLTVLAVSIWWPILGLLFIALLEPYVRGNIGPLGAKLVVTRGKPRPKTDVTPKTDGA
jgi:hypothetical protein